MINMILLLQRHIILLRACLEDVSSTCVMHKGVFRVLLWSIFIVHCHSLVCRGPLSCMGGFVYKVEVNYPITLRLNLLTWVTTFKLKLNIFEAKSKEDLFKDPHHVQKTKKWIREGPLLFLSVCRDLVGLTFFGLIETVSKNNMLRYVGILLQLLTRSNKELK